MYFSVKKFKHYMILEKAETLSLFFKTGKCQYGEGEVFLGINDLEQRIIVLLIKMSNHVLVVLNTPVNLSLAFQEAIAQCTA